MRLRRESKGRTKGRGQLGASHREQSVKVWNHGSCLLLTIDRIPTCSRHPLNLRRPSAGVTRPYPNRRCWLNNQCSGASLVALHSQLATLQLGVYAASRNLNLTSRLIQSWCNSQRSRERAALYRCLFERAAMSSGVCSRGPVCKSQCKSHSGEAIKRP